MDEDVLNDAAAKIGLAAIKYGDLSNQASKDYVFDVDRFTSFEGNTGPYILYTIVRTKSLNAKIEAQGINVDGDASDPSGTEQDGYRRDACSVQME